MQPAHACHLCRSSPLDVCCVSLRAIIFDVMPAVWLQVVEHRCHATCMGPHGEYAITTKCCSQLPPRQPHCRATTSDHGAHARYGATHVQLDPLTCEAKWACTASLHMQPTLQGAVTKATALLACITCSDMRPTCTCTDGPPGVPGIMLLASAWVHIWGSVHA